MATRALAIDLRDIDTGALVGVALFVPSERYAAMLIDGAGKATERKLTSGVWREIDRWAVAGDSGLPARPAPMSAAVVAALLHGERPAISGQRFAAIPMNADAAAAVGSTVKRLLPGLLDVRRSATA